MSEPVQAPAPPAAQVLGRADLLGMATSRKPKVQAVDLPDGKRVYVRMMDGFEFDEWDGGRYYFDRQTKQIKANNRNASARLAALCLCDESGKRLFSADGDADLLGRLDSAVLRPICKAASDLNGLDVAADEEKEKNSSSQAAASVPG